MDSFFQFDEGLPALGARKQEEELLTAEIDEDEYDALNDETFGDVAEDEDWEENHKRLAELDMKILNQSDDEPDINDDDDDDDDDDDNAQQSIVEKSISQLGLDDLDDPAIMTYGRSAFTNSPSSKFVPSPLSTSTIRHLDLENNLRNNSVENQKRTTIHPPSTYDQQSMGIGPLPRLASNTWTFNHSLSDLTNENAHWPFKSSSLPSCNAVRTVTDVEKDIFLKPRAQTLDDVEREMLSNRKIPSSPVSSGRPVQPPVGTPPQASSMITPMNLPHSPVNKVPFIGHCPPVLAPPQINPMFHQRFPRMVCQPPMINPFSMQFHPPRFLVGKNPAALKLSLGPHNFGPENPSSDICIPPGLPRMPLPVQYFQQQYQQNIVNWALRQQSTSAPPVNDGKDSYDGLMTFQEKDWLIKIQMRQLQSDNPYLDDYYYTTFMSKKKAKEKAKNGMNGNGEPKVLLPERIKMESRTYVPTQFEGSLGKLQVASVNNPRKILDVGICRLGDEEETKSTSTHRFCYTLLSIEKLYTTLLEIEDEDKHILALPETAQLRHQKARQELIDKLFFGLVKGTCNFPDDNFVHIVSVRKGRNLIMRSLQFLEESNQVALLILLFRCLNTVLRKDQHDLVLLHRCDVILKIIDKLDMVSVVLLAEAIQNVPPQGAISGKERSNYSVAFHTKFGVIIVWSLLKKAECHYLEDPDIEPDLQKRWASVIMHIVDILCALPKNVVIEMPTSVEDIVNHFERFSIEEDKLGYLIEKFQC